MLQNYERHIRSGRLQPDEAQQALAARLDELAVQLNRRKSLLHALFSSVPVRGLYIWGDVGRGKTMMMDLFFAGLTVHKKRRVHFHAFMQEVHERIFTIRQKQGDARTDPIGETARQVAQQAKILCFDEFAVTDVADAMILGRLFEALFAENVIVVATSNIPPDELYKGGLNRALFLPFIEQIKSHLDIAHLGGRQDYRLAKLTKSGVWFSGVNKHQAMDEAWQNIITEPQKAEALKLRGRTLHVPRSASGAARFTFAGLCEQPLGAKDYLELAQNYHTLFLDGIPAFTTERRSGLRRFITLVDILYDAHVKLVASAEAEPAALVQDMDDYEKFAYPRTVSRLIEMRGYDYLKLAHQGEPQQLEPSSHSG